VKRFLLTFIGLAFLASSLAGYLIFTGPRMKVQPYLPTSGSRMPLPPDGAIPVAVNRPTAPTPGELKAFSSLPATEENVKHGEIVFGYYCAFCHGAQGAGDGPVGKSYMPPPADLRSPRITALSDAGLLQAMFTGVGHEPVLGRIVAPSYRNLLVLYVRTLSGNHRGTFPAVGSEPSETNNER